MNYIVDQEQFALETISSHAQYLRKKPAEESRTSVMHVDWPRDEDSRMREAAEKHTYTSYTPQDKARFFKLGIEKCISASAAAKQLGIHVPFLIPVKRKGRRRILIEEHVKAVIDFIDANPSAAVAEVIEHLIQQFDSLKVTNSTSAFHIDMKRTRAWSKKGTPAIVTVPTTRAKTTAILGAISASGLIKVSLRVQRPVKKRKTGQKSGYVSSGIVTGYHISFLKDTLDEMDQYPHMKGHCLIMDNAPIHKSEDIVKYATSRGYRYAYLPSYSPELNPIEQFWSVAKKSAMLVTT
ncbi:hypothetical protein G6F70_009244 [Rhizopus microsporus]|nr:hypothetical protein G6F71_004141 [Rhizopus microsporus]KAG1192116.1 hypothetical protein G6F70_009244 [Rhizopus microsporus]KAG1205857.1 hypothetical protein G6F69_009223 [Rhizopus microsporus]KAG1225692.1 hypothetical protein G6F67_009235 [Rhizopus microsporus]KAG1266062.1 hypothetical protein G6F68_003071 [Rhizopus microsporus]